MDDPKNMFEQLAKSIEDTANIIQDVKVGVVDTALNVMFRRANKLTPRVTNTLIRGWGMEKAHPVGDDMVGCVFNPVEYAVYVEYGHRVMSHDKHYLWWKEGQFILTRAHDATERRMEKIIHLEMRKRGLE